MKGIELCDITIYPCNCNKSNKVVNGLFICRINVERPVQYMKLVVKYAVRKIMSAHKNFLINASKSA